MIKLALLAMLAWASLSAEAFHFVILGDRTGEVQAGVFEQVLQETAAENPAFIVTIGDSIQGLVDANADREWREMQQLLAPYKKFPLYLTPGNHDIWSELSARLYRKYSGRPLHYSFDHENAHFTILDNSRDDRFSAAELAWLEEDLKAHQAQPLKFVFSHRPSWIVDILLRNPHDEVHQLAKKYGVQYVISGHVHQMIHAQLEGVTYLSMPSAGGHLRSSEKYEDGWFFGHTLVNVDGTSVSFQIKEIAPSSRVSDLKVWGSYGLLRR